MNVNVNEKENENEYVNVYVYVNEKVHAPLLRRELFHTHAHTDKQEFYFLEGWLTKRGGLQ